MHRTVQGFLVLVVGIAGGSAADASRGQQSATPEQQFKALIKAYNEAFQEYSRAYRAAKTPAEQQKVVAEKYPDPAKWGGECLELIAKNPKAPFVEEGLIWTLTNEPELMRVRPWYQHAARYEQIWLMIRGGRQFGVPSKEEKEVRRKAISLLLRDHVASPNLGRVAELLGSSQDSEGAALLRAVRDKNPSKEVRAAAALALARRMQNRVALVKQLKDNPQLAKSVAQQFGPDFVEELRKADPAKLVVEAEKLYAELVERYLPDMQPAALALLCQQLYYTTDSEQLLRALYTKDKRNEVRGVACLVLGQVVLGGADHLIAGDPQAAARKRQEGEQLLEEAAEKYANSKTAFDGPVGMKAKNELFDLRHLSVGKAAPEIEGVDQDGKQFRLSEYQGKVVLLDFWSEF